MPKISLSVRAALGCLFAAMLAVSLIQSTAAVLSIRHISGLTDKLLEDVIKSINDAHAINNIVLRARLWQFRYMTTENETERLQNKEKYIEFAADRNKKVLAYQALVTSQEEKRAYDDLKAKIDLVISDGESLQAFQPDQHDEAMAFFHGQMNTNYLAVSAAARILVDINIEAGRRADAAIRLEQTSAMQTMLLMACSAVVVTFGAMVFCFLGVSRPIERMTIAMRRLAAGDTSVNIVYGGRRDEIGAMADAVAVFRENLIRTHLLEKETALARASAEEQRQVGMRQMADGFQHTVGGIIGMVSASANELQAAAQTMTATATVTANQSTTVATAAEEAASNVNTVAAAAEELGASVQEIGRQVAGSAELARTTMHEADQTGALVQELSTAVARIGDVVGLISNIAGQTNLLALNATIEAARAGVAGKGFAVVAAEVKALAEQTAKATGEISDQVHRIQASTGQAVKSIVSITRRIRDISGVATSIAAAVEQQGAATHEIVRNVSQAAMQTGEVTSNISGVAGAAEETGAVASQVLGAASDLSRQSEHLSTEVAKFLATVRAA